MKRFIFSIGLLAALAQTSNVWAAESVSDDFDLTPLNVGSAYSKAKSCIPSMGEVSFQRALSDTRQGGVVALRPPEGAGAGKSYLLIGRGQLVCVKISQNEKAILPLSAFRNTINFEGLRSEDTKKFFTDISLELAKTAAATALVVFSNGNAIQVVYLFANDLPTQFYYATAALKKGQFSAADYSNVAYLADGESLTVTVRGGGAGERVKFIGVE